MNDINKWRKYFIYIFICFYHYLNIFLYIKKYFLLKDIFFQTKNELFQNSLLHILLHLLNISFTNRRRVFIKNSRRLLRICKFFYDKCSTGDGKFPDWEFCSSNYSLILFGFDTWPFLRFFRRIKKC